MLPLIIDLNLTNDNRDARTPFRLEQVQTLCICRRKDKTGSDTQAIMITVITKIEHSPPAWLGEEMTSQ